MARDTKVDPAVIEAWKSARNLSGPDTVTQHGWPGSRPTRPQLINDSRIWSLCLLIEPDSQWLRPSKFLAVVGG